MYIMYIDESGTPDLGQKPDHFVLLGIAIPIDSWSVCSSEIRLIKDRHHLKDQELHTAWMAQKYPEQERIIDFHKKGHTERRRLVQNQRSNALLGLDRSRKYARHKALKKNYKKSAGYIHLTWAERIQFLKEIGDAVGAWRDAKLFCECVDKARYTHAQPIFQQSFEQVVSRFQSFLSTRSTGPGIAEKGIIVQDHNSSEAIGLTKLMRAFYKTGTQWRQINRIVETPLFVDSQITELVQIADYCAYATRRFFDNGEQLLFDKIYSRFDRVPAGHLVGLRHMTCGVQCRCKVCLDHGRYS